MSEPKSSGRERDAERAGKPNAGDEDQREEVLDTERKANEQQPRNFKDDAVTDKVIDLGPIDPDGSNIRDLDPPGR